MPSPDPVLELLGRFRRLMRAVQQHSERIERTTGMSGAQLWALTVIAERPGLRVSDLARALSVQPSTASNLLLRLEDLGLIERQRTRADRRSVLLHPTAAGRHALARAPQPTIGLLPDALSRLPERQRQQLGRVLDDLLRRMAIDDPQAALRPLPLTE